MVETEEGFSYSDNYSLYLHILALLWDTIIKINLQKKRKGKKHFLNFFLAHGVFIWQ